MCGPEDVKPYRYWLEDRILAIHRAILRCRNMEQEIPKEWLEELGKHYCVLFESETSGKLNPD